MGRLRDKVILITGAAGAVGSAVADAVVEAGGLAVTTDLAGCAGMDHALDVTSEEDWRRVIDDIDRAAGRLDGLVNAAGIATPGSVEDTDFATWRKVMAVNLDGTFLGCKYGLALLRRDGGAIVNISSVSGLVGGYNLAAYNASKGGVRLLTKSVALHGARLKPQVRCNSIHPVYTDTPMVGQMLAASRSPEKMLEGMKAMVPLGRLGTPEELAAMAVYLASDEAGFVTGAEFVFDGGYTAN